VQIDPQACSTGSTVLDLTDLLLPAGTTIVRIEKQPLNGGAVVNPGDNTLTYTPRPQGFVGTDAFLFTATRASEAATTYEIILEVGPQFCTSSCRMPDAQCTTGADCCSGVCSPGYVGGKPAGLCFDSSACPPCLSSHSSSCLGGFNDLVVSAPRTLLDESFFNLLLACGLINDCFQNFCDGSSNTATTVKALDLSAKTAALQSAARGATPLSVSSGLQLLFGNTAAAFGIWYTCSQPTLASSSQQPRRGNSPSPPPPASPAAERAPEFMLTAYSWFGTAVATNSLTCPPAGTGPAFTGWFAGTPVSAGIVSVSIAALPGTTSLLSVAATEYAPLLHADKCISWPIAGGGSLLSSM
jgi:hypothetical protein